MTTKTVTLIFTDEEVRGDGTKNNINRRVAKLYTLDGTLVCEYDHGVSDSPAYVNLGALQRMDR